MRLLFLLLFPATVAAQNATILAAKTDSVIEVTALHNRLYYKETAVFTGKKEFVQSVCYNQPHSVDEEFCYTLGMNFAATEQLAAGKTYDLAKDTAVLSCSFGQLSVWTWGYDTRPVFSGTVRILRVEEDEVTLEENIRIVRSNGEVMLYKGERTFRVKEED